MFRHSKETTALVCAGRQLGMIVERLVCGRGSWHDEFEVPWRERRESLVWIFCFSFLFSVLCRRFPTARLALHPRSAGLPSKSATNCTLRREEGSQWATPDCTQTHQKETRSSRLTHLNFCQFGVEWTKFEAQLAGKDQVPTDCLSVSESRR